jgi:hypothetical protein
MTTFFDFFSNNYLRKHDFLTDIPVPLSAEFAIPQMSYIVQK